MNMTNRIKVWDPLVRLFHWSLVAAFAVAYLTEEDYLPLHTWAGYIVLGLISFRLIWGVIGSRHARFSDFLYSPATVMAFIRDTLNLRARRYLGHNPAGGAMILMLLASLLLTGFTGLAIYGIAEQAGPLAGLSTSPLLAEAFEEVHEFFANFTLLLVIVHVAGVIVESLLHQENLVRAMLDGYKRRDAASQE